MTTFSSGHSQGYAFVAMACKHAKTKDAEIEKVVLEAKEIANDVVGNNVRNVRPSSIGKEDSLQLLRCLVELLQDLRDRTASHVEACMAVHRTDRIALSVEEIYRLISDIDDQDGICSAYDRLIAASAARWEAATSILLSFQKWSSAFTVNLHQDHITFYLAYHSPSSSHGSFSRHVL